jgi:hypothetical protein
MDRWKVSTVVLGGVFALVVAGRHVDDADAQVKTVGPQKIGAPQKSSPGQKGQKGQKGPVRIGGDPEPPKADDAAPAAPSGTPTAGPVPVPVPGGPPAEETPSFGEKGTPMERATKVLEHAKKTLSKLKPDPEGHRNKALKHIETAMSEARAIPKAE